MIIKIIILENDILSDVADLLIRNVSNLENIAPIYYLPHPYIQRIVPLLNTTQTDFLKYMIMRIVSSHYLPQHWYNPTLDAFFMPVFRHLLHIGYVFPIYLIRHFNMKISLQKYLLCLDSSNMTISHAVDILNNLDIFYNDMDPNYKPSKDERDMVDERPLHIRINEILEENYIYNNPLFIKLLIELNILTKENIKKFDLLHMNENFRFLVLNILMG
jgi:hypothetical protein